MNRLACDTVMAPAPIAITQSTDLQVLQVRVQEEAEQVYLLLL